MALTAGKAAPERRQARSADRPRLHGAARDRSAMQSASGSKAPARLKARPDARSQRRASQHRHPAEQAPRCRRLDYRKKGDHPDETTTPQGRAVKDQRHRQQRRSNPKGRSAQPEQRAEHGKAYLGTSILYARPSRMRGGPSCKNRQHQEENTDAGQAHIPEKARTRRGRPQAKRKPVRDGLSSSSATIAKMRLNQTTTERSPENRRATEPQRPV